MPPRIHRVTVASTPSLDAILHEPEGTPVAGLVVAHPHPLFGGTMGSAVVGAVARAAAERGILTLRFNFRGVGRSGGEYGAVAGAAEDVANAAAHVVDRLDAPAPFLLAGYSFGALAVARSLDVVRPRAAAFIGYPFQGDPTLDLDRDPAPLARFPGPLYFASGDVDEFGPGTELAARLADARVRAHVEVLPGVGHFFDGATARLADGTVDWFLAQIR